MKKSILTICLMIITLTTLSFQLRLSTNVYAKKDNHQTKEISNNKKVKGESSPGTSTVQKSYAFEITNINTADSVQINDLFKAKLTIKNTSNFTWKKSDIKLSYHWVDTNEQFEVYRGDAKQILKNVNVNESIVQTINVRAPEIPGTFKLLPDLIEKNTWFSEKANKLDSYSVKVDGEQKIYDEKIFELNGGAEYANNSNFTIENFEELNFQPNSINASFLYQYAQVGFDKNWSKWQNKSDSKWDIGFTEPYAGMMTVYSRFRAFKKLSNATPDTYGDAQYKYGRSSKTTGLWWDDIFFDNIPPEGSIVINNGASYTYSNVVDLTIKATDDLYGFTGSGLNGMRLDISCNGIYGDWESINNKNSVNLGSGSILKACVQFRDKAGNLSKVYSDSITFYIPNSVGNSAGGIAGIDVGNTTYVDANGNRIVSKLAGTAADPFGQKTALNYEQPEVHISSVITNVFGSRKLIINEQVPPPEITFMQINENRDKLKIYGVGIQKYDEAKFTIIYEDWKEGCFSLLYRECITTTGKTITGKLEHVGISLYEDKPWWWITGDPEVGWTWNDNAEGLWTITADYSDTLSGPLNEGDYIYARSRAWGSIDTGIPQLGIVNYGELTSGKSNIEEVRNVLSRSIYDEFGVKLTNGDSSWSEDQLVYAYKAFAIIPKWMYENYLVEIERNTEFYNEVNPMPQGWTDTNVVGKKIEIYNSAGSGPGLTELIVHETMHAYQFKFGGQRSDAHSKPNYDSIIHQYYIENGYSLIDCNVEPKSCGRGTYYDCEVSINDRHSFVSYYARISGCNPTDARPFEDMAESLTFFLLDQSAFTTFDEDRDALYRYPNSGITDGDAKKSEVLKAKYNFIDNYIL